MKKLVILENYVNEDRNTPFYFTREWAAAAEKDVMFATLYKAHMAKIAIYEEWLENNWETEGADTNERLAGPKQVIFDTIREALQNERYLRSELVDKIIASIPVNTSCMDDFRKELGL